MKRDVWQSYDCPFGADSDLDGAQMVHRGASFWCHWCHQFHEAGEEVAVETFVRAEDGSTTFHELPATADDLRRLVEGVA